MLPAGPLRVDLTNQGMRGVLCAYLPGSANGLSDIALRRPGLSLQNGATVAATAKGPGLQFTSYNQSAQIPGFNPNGLAQMTIAILLRVDAGNAIGKTSRLLANSHLDFDNSKLGLELYFAGSFLFFYLGTGSAQASCNINQSIGSLVGKIIRVVAVYTGTAITLYLNGVASSPTALTGNVAAGPFASMGIFYNPTYNDDYVNGTLLDLQFTSQAWSAEQVALDLLETFSGYQPVSPLSIWEAASSPPISAGVLPQINFMT